MRILFTGASSFTGFWFVKTLKQAGHELTCPLSGSDARYSGVRKHRYQSLRELCQTIPDAPFGSESFIDILRHCGPFDLLCHHGADVANYRSPDFDPWSALQNNTRNITEVLCVLKASTDTPAVVLTGTVFECDEGAGTEPLRAFSPYGLSKGLTFQTFRYFCERAEVPLGKFVVPNPFGPFEEERFTAYLCRSWREGKIPVVKTPDYSRDNIPVDLLARCYALFCHRTTHERQPLTKVNPSGYIETQGAFASRVAKELAPRTGWDCRLSVQKQTDFTEPMVRVNTEPATILSPDWNETGFWDQFSRYYAD